MSNQKLRSPIIWIGGKFFMRNKLLPLIPKHRIYVEVFGGGAQLLFAKEPSLVEVYNDIDSGLVNFFRVLRDPEKFEQFYRKVCLTPYSREEYYYCRDTWESCEDEIERAYRWYVVARMSFGGEFGGSWGYVVTKSARGMSKQVSKWLAIIDLLPEIHQRIMRVQIEHDDFRKIIKRYDTSETFFYLDPPYVHSTRKEKDNYIHEITDEDHRQLVDILLTIQGKVMLSGYQNEIYKKLEEHGWKRLDFNATCFAVGCTRNTAKSKQKRVESVWINYELPE